MRVQVDVSGLVDEYRALFDGLDSGERELLEQRLISGSEWTPLAAEHLLQLAKDYGSFMLRNALAIAVALNIEDGELRF